MPRLYAFVQEKSHFQRADISDAIPLTLQFIYLDVDICVSMYGDISDGEMHKLTEEEYEVMLKRVYDDKESKLLALRICSYGKTLDDDEAAWNGKDDPFVHLTADERQSIMKQ